MSRTALWKACPMTQLRALAERERFLSSDDSEVVSVSGRWGVGKTYAWDRGAKSQSDASAAANNIYFLASDRIELSSRRGH